MRIKRAVCCLLAAFFVSGFALTAFAKSKYPSPSDGFFVNDFANVISSEDAQKMSAIGEQLYKKTGSQAVVVTIQSLNGESVEDYSIGLAREWGIGSKGKDNGVLLLLSVQDRKVRIEVGSGLEGALTDGKTGRIMDTYGIDYFKKNEFSSGLRSVYNSIVNEVYIEYDIEPDSDYEPVSDEGGVFTLTNFARIAVIIIIIIVSIKRSRSGRGGRGGPPFFFFGGGGFSGGSGFSGGRSGFSGGGGGFSGGGSSRGF